MQGQLSVSRPTPRETLADWLTVERAVYAGIAVLALGLRLYGLDQTPLGPAEAAQALPAWAAAVGQPYDLVGVSPLLFGWQWLLFALFGAGDAVARFWPAMFGGLAPLLFYALRDRLTRGGALIAALLWAMSAVAVFAGRLALDQSLVAPLALALLAALNIWTQRAESVERKWPLRWAAVILGLLLVSGPAAYTVLLVGFIAALGWRRSLPALWASIKADGRGLALAFLIPLVLGATSLFLAPAGLAAAADLLGRWLLGLRPGVGTYGAWEILYRLLLSEPLLVGFGVAGLIWSLRWRDRFGVWAGMAAGVALFVPLLGRGRQPVDLALVVLALTLLSGPAIARALRPIRLWRDQADPWLLVALSVVLLTTATLSLPSAWSPANTAEWRQLYSGVGIVTAALVVLVWVVYGVFGNWRIVAQAVPVVLLLFGVAWGIGQTVALSYDRGAGRQAAALAQTPAPDTADLVAAVRDLSALHGGGSRDGKIDLIWPNRPGDPMLAELRWLLRDHAGLRVAAAIPADAAPIVITAAENQPALASRYSGVEFPVLQTWRPRNLGDFSAYLRWVLYREAKTTPDLQKVILWVDRTQK